MDEVLVFILGLGLRLGLLGLGLLELGLLELGLLRILASLPLLRVLALL